MVIENCSLAVEPEKLLNPFGFKGSSLTELWQVYVKISGGNETAIGVGVQSVLWSDANVFSTFGEQRSNALMYKVTEKALELIKGKEFSSPKAVLDDIFDTLYGYAKKITGMPVSETFVLNALVSVDFALWSLYLKQNGKSSFSDIYNGDNKHKLLANIPLITYGTSLEKVKELADSGVCLFKIKIGYNAGEDLSEMVKWDKKRMLDIHNLLKRVKTPYTESGNVLYYFDANGRYDTKERLEELVSFMVENGVAERTVTFEEPFAPESKISVKDMPINFAVDESVHSVKDVEEKIALGYKTITLKPIAKTLTKTIEIADCAKKHGVQCFCADLTVNPYLVEWNKNFACRLNVLKGMKIGVVESNGAQNYLSWNTMVARQNFPFEEGVIYRLGKEFYENSGGVFNPPSYYSEYISNFCKERNYDI